MSRLRARCPLKVCSASAARAPAPATCARGAQACDAQADSRHVAQGLPGLGAAWHNARSTRATHLAHATAVPGDLGVFEQGLRCRPVARHTLYRTNSCSTYRRVSNSSNAAHSFIRDLRDHLITLLQRFYSDYYYFILISIIY